MQPQPPSSEPSADATAATEAGSETTQSSTSNFLQRLWRGMRSGGEEEQDQPSEPAPSTVQLTQEELDRRVQAETDRREFRRQQEARDAERRRLRDEDPWAYAEQDRQAEQQVTLSANAMAQLGQVGETHDRYTLDPLFNTLPPAEQHRILALEGAGIGLEGRKLIVTESIKALEKHWKEEGEKEAERKLRRNPAFRKQVLGEFRRGMTEPEYVGSGAPSQADRDVSNILRDQIRARH